MKIERTDVAIIGGGIVGCATAYYLAKQGIRSIVLERDNIASEQSSRAWGFVRQQGRHIAEVEYAAASRRIWEGLADELQADLEYVQRGILVPVETLEDEERFNDAARIGVEHGLSTRMIKGQELHDIIPELVGSWRAGLYTKEDGHAEPRKATEAFAAAAKRLGAVFMTNTPVLGIDVKNNKVAGVVTATGTIEADTVLCAAGIGSAQLLSKFDIDLPIQLIRTFVSETNPTQPFTQTAMWGPYISFRPTCRGTFYIGAGYRTKLGTEHDVTLASLHGIKYFLPTYLSTRKHTTLKFGKEFFLQFGRLLSGAKRFNSLPEPTFSSKWAPYAEQQFYKCFPHLAGLGIARTWSGRIDMTPDLLPIIGESDSIKRLFVATGFSGHGFALGPATGKFLSELIVSGNPSINLRPFRISRFAEGDIQRSPQAL